MIEKESLSELPEGWVRTRVGELIAPSNEKVNPTKLPEMAYIGLGHIEKDSGKLLSHGYLSEVRSTKTRFYTGDLLYGKLRPYLNKVHVADFDGICSTDILVFSKTPFFSNKYLSYRFLYSDFVRFSSQNVSGVHHPRVNFETLSQFVFSLPPLPEQNRIVAKIEELFTKLDAGVEDLKKVKEQLKSYRQSVLKHAFGGKLTAEWREEHKDELEPASNLLERIKEERKKDVKWKYKELSPADIPELPELPEGWVWTRVGEICQIISGQTPKGINEQGSEGEIPYFKVGDMNKLGNEIYMFHSDIALDLDVIDKLGLRIQDKGTIIFPKRGGAIGTNKKRILAQPSAYDLNIMGVYPLIMPYLFFYYWILSVNLITLSDGSNVPQINHKDIEPLRFPLPLIPEQHQIVEEIERRFSIADEVEKTVNKSLKQADRLRQSILKRAFEGKLVPQDPTDEPAIVLLERIKAERENRKLENKTRTKNKIERETKQRSFNSYV